MRLIYTLLLLISLLSSGICQNTEPSSEDRLPPADDFFGMGLYLYRYPMEEMERAAAMCRSMGAGWVRDEFNWARIEPVKGEYHWELADAAVEAAVKADLKIVGLIAYWAPWVEPYSDESYEAYSGFVSKVVDRYKDRIGHWEIWNEPNSPTYWTGTPKEYVRLLKEAYRGALKADPECRILIGGISHIDTFFLEKVYDSGAKYYFHIMNIHPYRTPSQPVYVFRSEMKALKELMSREESTEDDSSVKPIWFTEVGYPGGTEESREVQADFVTHFMLQARASGVEKVFWYDFRDDGDNKGDPEHNFGLIQRDWNPKPAYYAWMDLAVQTAGWRWSKRVSTPKGFYLDLYRRGKGYALIGWGQESNGLAVLPEKLKGDFRTLTGEEYNFGELLRQVGPSLPLYSAPAYILFDKGIGGEELSGLLKKIEVRTVNNRVRRGYMFEKNMPVPFLSANSCGDDQMEIDGDLNEECWLKARWSTPFVQIDSPLGSPVQTRAAFLYNSRNLYVAFRCEEPKIGGMKADFKGHDSPVYLDDSVELLVDTNLDEVTYYHFVVNSAGIKYDEMGDKSISWDPEWDVKVGKSENEWTVECRIPRKVFNLTSMPPNNSWNVNMMRNRYVSGESEHFAWSCPYGSIHKPWRFGTLSFSTGANYENISP